MSKYTPEQVEELSNALPDAYVDQAVALDAYAATLRQQAEGGFDSPEALAAWLESLHECHPRGAVGNRKWQAAQVAASAIRAMGQGQISPGYTPSDMSASFRAGMNTQRMQQAERSGVAVSDAAIAAWVERNDFGSISATDARAAVEDAASLLSDGNYWRGRLDERNAQKATKELLRTAPAEQGGRVDYFAMQRIADEYGLDYNKFCAATASLAALAQNTQGEVRIVCDWKGADPFPRFIEAETPEGKSISLPWHDRADGLKEFHLYLHAERARVPEGWQFRAIPGNTDCVAAIGPNGEEWWIGCDHKLHSLFKALLAAAPSQPKDSGEEL